MKKSKYVEPSQVSSPRKHWKLLTVLESGAQSTGSVALGRWNDKPVLAMRWNGDEENHLGNPQSRGLPTWFIIPNEYRDSILSGMAVEKQALAKAFLGGL